MKVFQNKEHMIICAQLKKKRKKSRDAPILGQNWAEICQNQQKLVKNLYYVYFDQFRPNFWASLLFFHIFFQLIITYHVFFILDYPNFIIFYVFFWVKMHIIPIFYQILSIFLNFDNFDLIFGSPLLFFPIFFN